MNSLSLPVVHPAFQKLKRSGRFLHLAAGSLILVHAISHYQQPHSSPVYLGCLLLMALDIFILVIACKNILLEMPRINLFFRIIEILFFLGIGANLLLENQWGFGIMHLLICGVYIFLYYCEKNVNSEENIGIHHTGISIPSLPGNKFFLWTHINQVEAHYDSIVIDTSESKSYQFDLRENLAFEELDQIHEFCRHYLGEG